MPSSATWLPGDFLLACLRPVKRKLGNGAARWAYPSQPSVSPLVCADVSKAEGETP